MIDEAKRAAPEEELPKRAGKVQGYEEFVAERLERAGLTNVPPDKRPAWCKRYLEIPPEHLFKCPSCGCPYLSDEWNYCTNCGKPIPH